MFHALRVKTNVLCLFNKVTKLGGCDSLTKELANNSNASNVRIAGKAS